MLLHQKRVCVLGAASPRGQAVARLCAEQGAHLVLVDEDELALRELARVLRSEGRWVQVVGIKTSTDDDLHAGIEAALALFDGYAPDLLVALPPRPAEPPWTPDESLEALVDGFRRAIFWHFWACQAALTRMKGGTLICLSDDPQTPDLPSAPAHSVLTGLMAWMCETAPEVRVHLILSRDAHKPWVNERVQEVLAESCAAPQQTLDAAQVATAVLMLSQWRDTGHVLALQTEDRPSWEFPWQREISTHVSWEPGP